MDMKDVGFHKEVKGQNKLKTCNLCGCSLQSKTFARHLKTKKHKDVDYAYNKFEMTKYEAQANKKNKDFIILKLKNKKQT